MDGSYVTVREMYQVKDALLAEMKAMESRLTERIDHANDAHSTVHAEMTRRADQRHALIDTFLAHEAQEDAVKAALMTGRSDAYRQIVGVLRLVSEFRWLIVLVATALLVLSGNVRINLAS